MGGFVLLQEDLSQQRLQRFGLLGPFDENFDIALRARVIAVLRNISA
ncbi:MAG: hypothetical protein QM811_24525 [Pirellulales bacterium]